MTDEELKDQLARLPRRALVAFAARCARRVRPLAAALPEDSLAAVDEAIVVATAVARGDDGPWVDRASAAANEIALATANKATSSAEAARAAEAAAEVVWVVEPAKAVWAAARAARAAQAAAEAAACAAAPAGVTDEDSDVSYADIAGAEAAGAAAGVAAADVKQLLARGPGEPGTIGAPIDPSESGPLGPLWPSGAPDWLSQREAKLHIVHVSDMHFLGGVFPLAVYLDPGDAPPELITDFYLALSAVYRSLGGSGLQITNDELRSLVGEEADR